MYYQYYDVLTNKHESHANGRFSALIRLITLAKRRTPSSIRSSNWIRWSGIILSILPLGGVSLVQAVPLTGVNQLGVGAAHACALTSNGGVQCWGSNINGQLGDNSLVRYKTTPVAVNGLTSGVTAIGGSYNQTCAVVSGGAQCWGSPGYGSGQPAPVAVSGLTSGVTAIAAGFAHTCAVVNGGVQCWGGNNFAQLGDNSTSDHSTPMTVSGLTSGVTAIATGTYHTCALVSGGVQCWGFNDGGQLGDNSTTSRLTPVAVSGLTSGVTAVVTGDHSCAVVNGGAQCWGRNNFGQLGDNTTTNRLTPVAVRGLTSGVTAITIGKWRTCALVNGGVQCWGYNNLGQLGNTTTKSSLTPVAVSGLTSGVTAIGAGGGDYTCAVVGGGVQCWGDNSLGQLGDNSTTSRVTPVAVVMKGTPPAANHVSLSLNPSGPLTGTFGEVLKGNYTYSDVELDAESGTSFQWYQATDSTCRAGKTAIAGAKALTYTVVSGDVGKYICFGVTPQNANGGGTEVLATSSNTITNNVTPVTPVISVTPPASETVVTPQTISFTPPTNGTVGDNTSLSATATSALAVTFTSTTSSLCTVNGANVSYVGIGTCTITADQAGDTNYRAASVSGNITVGLATQTVSFTPPARGTPGGSARLSATATSDLTVTFASTTPNLCTVDDTTVHYVDVGTCTITAEQAGNTHYSAAPPVSGNTTVGLATQRISFTSPTSGTTGGSARLSATATSGLPVTFASTTPSLCTVDDTIVNYMDVGTCTLTATQAGNANYATASPVSSNITITEVNCDSSITIRSVQDGRWTDSSTWDAGRSPNSSDVVWVNNHTINSLPAIVTINALCNQGTLTSKRDSSLEIEAAGGIHNYAEGTIRGEDGINDPTSSNKCNAGKDVTLKAATGVKSYESHSDLWYYTYSRPSPIVNQGKILGGTGQNGTSCGGKGGNVTVLGRGVTNHAGAEIKGGQGGTANAGKGGDGGRTKVFGRFGGSEWGKEGFVTSQGRIVGGNGGNGTTGGQGNSSNATTGGQGFVTNQGRIVGGNGSNGTTGGQGFVTNQGRIVSGNGSNGIAGGQGGNLWIVGIPNVQLGPDLTDTSGCWLSCPTGHNAGTGGLPNGESGEVLIEPSIISITAGDQAEINGDDVTIFGGDDWTLNLSGATGTVIAATNTLTLAVGNNGVVDLRGNRRTILRAGGEVKILSDQILLDPGVILSTIIAAPKITLAPSKILRSVTLSGSNQVTGRPDATLPIRFTIANGGPQTDTYQVVLSDETGWRLETSLELPAIDSRDVELAVKLPATMGEAKVITIVATSQADSEVTDMMEIRAIVTPEDEEVAPNGTTSSPPAVIFLPVTIAGANLSCASTGDIGEACNYGGREVMDLNVQGSGTVSNGILKTTIVNTGWVSNFHITATGKLSGGVVTGYIVNEGVMLDFDFKGMSVIGGTLGGVITNTSQVGGYFQDVSLLPKTKITGGTLKGQIKGDKNAPALLEDVRVKRGSKLSGVKLGKNVKLEKGVILEQ